MRVHAIHQGQDHQVQASQAESSIRPNKGRSKPVRPDLFAIGSSADDPARAGPAGLGQSGPSPSAGPGRIGPGPNLLETYSDERKAYLRLKHKINSLICRGGDITDIFLSTNQTNNFMLLS